MKELKIEEQIRVLETEIKHKVKKIKEVEKKKNTLLEDRSSTLEATLKEGEKDKNNNKKKNNNNKKKSYKRLWNYDVGSTFIIDAFVPF
jgi:hypothetical protein